MNSQTMLKGFMFKGSNVALVTLFKNNKLDEETISS